MSLRDLKQMGLLRPENKWSDTPPKSHVCAWLALLWCLMALGGCTLMVIGDGGLWTWIGLALFAIALVAFVRTNMRSVTQ